MTGTRPAQLRGELIVAMSDAQGQAQTGSAADWITTSRAARGSERGLLHELRITAYLIVGMIAILAVAIVLG